MGDMASSLLATDGLGAGGLGEVAILGETAAGEDTHAVGIPDDLRAVAVEFDLVNSVVPFGRLLHQGRHQRLDERQPDPTGRLTRRNSRNSNLI